MHELKRNFKTWLFGLDRSKKLLLLIFFDSFSIIFITLLAFFIRLESTEYLYQLDTYIAVFIALTTTISLFISRGLYNNVTRYFSLEASLGLIIGCFISALLLLVCIIMLKLEIPRSVPFIYSMLLFLSVVGIRYMVGYIGRDKSEEIYENIAIFGVGAADIQLMEALRKDPKYKVKLFIDDNCELDNINISNVPVCYLDHAKKKIKESKIRVLLLSNSSYTEEARQKVFNILPDYPLKVKIIPSVSSLISQRFDIADLNEIKIDDLLGRDPVPCKAELMAQNISKKIVLVTGAGGSIGSELCRQIMMWRPEKLILIDISEFSIYRLLEELKQHPSSKEVDLIPLIGSVQNRKFVKKILNVFTVDTIYHAAAYKHVPLMEQNVVECIQNNIFGTLNIAEAAIASKVKFFTFISTDKAVNPTSFMGASKRFAEIICKNLSVQKTSTCFSIVRFGNVLGSSGSVVPLFKRQIKNGGPVTLTHPDVTRYFMTIQEAAQLVIQSTTISNGGEVFVLDMGKPIKILDLAKRMITLSGQQPILNQKQSLKNDEIPIIISGLRPGEKIFEELTYSSNLKESIHPRIKIASESTFDPDRFQELLEIARNAIVNSDNKKLFKIISTVTTGVTDITSSKDIFSVWTKSKKI